METRELIAQLFDLISKTDTKVEKFTMANGVATFKFSSAVGNTVTVNGETLVGTTVNNRTTYTYTQYLSKEQNYLDLSVTSADNEVQAVSFYVGGKFVTYDMKDYSDKFTVLAGGTGAMEVVDGMNVYKAEIPTGEGSTGVALDITELDINTRKKSFTLNVYNYGEEIKVTIMAYSKKSDIVEIGTWTLKTGMNTVTYQLSKNFGSYETLYILTERQEAILGVGNIIVEG